MACKFKQVTHCKRALISGPSFRKPRGKTPRNRCFRGKSGGRLAGTRILRERDFKPPPKPNAHWSTPWQTRPTRSRGLGPPTEKCLYIRVGPRPLVHRPTRGQTDPPHFRIPKQASGAAHGAGDGRSRVDIGRCEAQGGAPCPRRSPPATGPRGPLGPWPPGLAPWMAVQAPKPHPIRPQAGAAAKWGGYMPHPRDKTGLGGHNTPDWTHDSAPGWWRSWRLGVCGSGPGGF